MNDEFNLPASPILPDQGANLAPVRTGAEERQDERQSAIPALYKTTHERLACELALRMDDTDAVFERYGYSPEAAQELMESPAFAVLLAKVGTEIRENGLSFRLKAKAISEELLPTAFDLATDPLCSAAVRADLIKWAARVAGNEPAPAKGVEQGSGGFTLSITFAGQEPMRVVGSGSAVPSITDAEEV